MAIVHVQFKKVFGQLHIGWPDIRSNTSQITKDLIISYYTQRATLAGIVIISNLPMNLFTEFCVYNNIGLVRTTAAHTRNGHRQCCQVANLRLNIITKVILRDTIGCRRFQLINT